MTSNEHLDILNKGVGHWNEWRRQETRAEVDLSGVGFPFGDLREVNFGGANLRGIFLPEADLSGANLNEANLNEANLLRAQLKGADLSAATMLKADLRRANLSDADLSGADLSGADLSGANLKEADLSDTDLGGANLTKADLREVNLKGANLRGTDLGGVCLSGVDLRGVDLTEVDLGRADLSKADLSGVDLREANLRGANLRGTNLKGANLSGTNLSEANLCGADLTGCRIYAISVWNVHLKHTIQTGLIITPYNEATITVDNLEVAQFIYLLLKHEKIRDVLNAVTERGVLLLGHFSDGGLETLQSIAAELRKMKYLPMLFDFERPNNRDYTETVKTLVGLARIVIVDVSGPSVPQELYATIPHFAIPFVTIIEAGRKEHSMFRDLLKYPWVFPPVTFTDKEQLIKLLPSRIIEPAEKVCQERQTLLNQLFYR